MNKAQTHTIQEPVNNTRVLLIENEAPIAMEMKMILQRGGIAKENITHVYSKKNAEALIEKYGSENLPFDLILTDKDVNGGTTDSLIEMFKESNIPLGSISGENDQSDEFGMMYVGKNIKNTAEELIELFYIHKSKIAQSVESESEEQIA